MFRYKLSSADLNHDDKDGSRKRNWNAWRKASPAAANEFDLGVKVALFCRYKLNRSSADSNAVGLIVEVNVFRSPERNRYCANLNSGEPGGGVILFCRYMRSKMSSANATVAEPGKGVKRLSRYKIRRFSVDLDILGSWFGFGM